MAPRDPGRWTWLYALLLPLLVANGLWVAAALRVQNHVTAKDPHLHYIPVARRIVETDWSGEEIRRAARQYAPSWPLILAAAIEAAGTTGPDWVNTGVGVVWWTLLGLLAWRRVRDPLAPALVLGLGWTVPLAGYPHNIHFLVYAFRDLPMLAGVLAAMTAMLAARPRPLLAALTVVAATSVREVALAGVLGAMAAMLVLHRSGRGRNTLWFGIPLVALAAVAVMVVGGHHQALRFWRELSLHEPLRLVRFAARHTHWILWPGLLGALLAARRWPGLVLAWGGAVLGFWAVYSLTTWHPRYSLTLLMWAGPLAGLGLLWWARRLPGRLGTGVGAVAALALAAWAGWTVPGMGSWGSKHSAKEVRAFRAAIHRQVQPGDVAVAPRYATLAAAALRSHTRARQRQNTHLRAELDAGHRVFHLEPVNEAGVVTGPGESGHGVRGLEALAAYLDLRPPGTEPNPVRVRLGAGEFDLFEVRRWKERERSDWIHPNGRDAWLLLDLRETVTNATRTLRVESPRGTVGMEHALLAGSGLKVIHVPGDAQTPPRQRIRLVSDHGLPFYFQTAFLPGDRPIRFDLGDARLVSVLRWFQGDGFLLQAPGEEYGVALLAGLPGRLAVPLPENRETASVEVTMIFLTHLAAPPPLGIRWRSGAESGEQVIPEDQRKIVLRVVAPVDWDARQCVIELRTEPGPGREAPLLPTRLFVEYK